MNRRPREDEYALQSGLIVGGQGGPVDELLEDGQEEVFARAELESGQVEHQAGEDTAGPPAAAQARKAGPRSE